MAGLAGVTAIETNAGVIVSVVVKVNVPFVAVMVVVPTAMPDATPETEIVAQFVFDELQAVDPVIFCVVLSEYVPVAVNCCVAPSSMLGVAGVNDIETSVTVCVTAVSVADPDIFPTVALMVVDPAVRAVARPEFEMLILILSEEVQVAEFVMSCVELSEYVPVAANCWLAPDAIVGLSGVTDIDVRVAPALFFSAEEPHADRPSANIAQAKM